MSTPLVVALVLSSVALLLSLGAFVVASRKFGRNEKDTRIAELEKELEGARARARAAEVKVTPELLARYADEAVAYANQVAPLQEKDLGRKLTGAEKFEHAAAALRRRDTGDNGRRDWTDAEHRIAIEAVLARRRREEASNSKPAKA